MHSHLSNEIPISQNWNSLVFGTFLGLHPSNKVYKVQSSLFSWWLPESGTITSLSFRWCVYKCCYREVPNYTWHPLLHIKEWYILFTGKEWYYILFHVKKWFHILLQCETTTLHVVPCERATLYFVPCESDIFCSGERVILHVKQSYYTFLHVKEWYILYLVTQLCNILFHVKCWFSFSAISIKQPLGPTQFLAWNIIHQPKQPSYLLKSNSSNHSSRRSHHLLSKLNWNTHLHHKEVHIQNSNRTHSRKNQNNRKTFYHRKSPKRLRLLYNKLTSEADRMYIVLSFYNCNFESSMWTLSTSLNPPRILSKNAQMGTWVKLITVAKPWVQF